MVRGFYPFVPPTSCAYGRNGNVGAGDIFWRPEGGFMNGDEVARRVAKWAGTTLKID